MIDLHSSTEHIKTIIKEKIKHTYLSKYIEEPEINDDKLSILSMIVGNSTLSKYKQEQYIITTMLVQIALDTHDLVPITNNVNDSEATRTTKQLTVLAGDYFSGLYYLLLADIKDIKMISLLASAIKEINEHKMQLYYNELDSFQDYITVLKKVDSLLIVRVAEYLNNEAIANITGELLINNLLLREKQNIYTKEATPILDNWLNYTAHSSLPSLLSMVEFIIEKNTNHIKKTLSHHPHHMSVFKTHFHYVFKELVYSNTSSVVEEG